MSLNGVLVRAQSFWNHPASRGDDGDCDGMSAQNTYRSMYRSFCQPSFATRNDNLWLLPTAYSCSLDDASAMVALRIDDNNNAADMSMFLGDRIRAASRPCGNLMLQPEVFQI